ELEGRLADFVGGVAADLQIARRELRRLDAHGAAGALPELLDRRAAGDHGGVRRQDPGVVGVDGDRAGDVAAVERLLELPVGPVDLLPHAARIAHPPPSTPRNLAWRWPT